MKKGKLSASLMCTSIDKIFYYLAEFKETNLELLHIDIMDGDFVPNLALGTDYVKSLRRITDIPFDYHFLVKNAKEKMTWFEIREGDQVAFHYESNDEIQACLDYLKRLGAKKFIAINPETNYEVLDPYLDQLDGILVMTVKPGFAGQKIVDTSFEKVRKLKNHLNKLNYHNIEIEVDGNITIQNANRLYKLGANIFVSGSSSLFSKTELPVKKIIEEKRKAIGWK